MLNVQWNNINAECTNVFPTLKHIIESLWLANDACHRFNLHLVGLGN